MVLENGMYKCGVCGKAFPLEIGGHYISRDNGKSGLLAAIQSNPEEQLFDTFDCPHCGCQNVAQSRKRRFIESAVDYEEDTEIDSETEVETECDDDGPACEGTGPDCMVPCPGIADCPLCQEPQEEQDG